MMQGVTEWCASLAPTRTELLLNYLLHVSDTEHLYDEILRGNIGQHQAQLLRVDTTGYANDGCFLDYTFRYIK